MSDMPAEATAAPTPAPGDTVATRMTTDPEFVAADATLRAAALMMAEHDVGAVLVGTAEAPEGILTGRDILLRAVVKGLDPNGTTVREIMSSALFTCAGDMPAADAARMMQDHQVRRLPVADPNGRIVGIVSASDLAAAADPS